MSNQTQKLAIFSIGQKGGSGKTTFARAYLDVARNVAGRAVAAFDADGQVGQLVQYYGTRTDRRLDLDQDALSGVSYFNLRSDRERDTVLNAIDVAADIILMDLPGGSLEELTRVLDAKDGGRKLMEAYGQAGYRVVLVLTISAMKASGSTVMDAIELFGESVEYLVVKNLAFAAEDEFLYFDGYAEGDSKFYGEPLRALRRVKGGLMVMQPMKRTTYNLLDYENLTFADAMVPGVLPTADRARVRAWFDSFIESLESTAIAL